MQANTHLTTMKTLPLIAILLSSCAYADSERAIMLGGKGAAKGAAVGRSYSMVWDGRESFRDGAMLATAAVGAWASVASTEVAETTTRAVNSNSTKQAINASNNATKEVLGAQKASVETTKILAQ